MCLSTRNKTFFDAQRRHLNGLLHMVDLAEEMANARKIDVAIVCDSQTHYDLTNIFRGIEREDMD